MKQNSASLLINTDQLKSTSNFQQLNQPSTFSPSSNNLYKNSGKVEANNNTLAFMTFDSNQHNEGYLKQPIMSQSKHLNEDFDQDYREQDTTANNKDNYFITNHYVSTDDMNQMHFNSVNKMQSLNNSINNQDTFLSKEKNKALHRVEVLSLTSEEEEENNQEINQQNQSSVNSKKIKAGHFFSNSVSHQQPYQQYLQQKMSCSTQATQDLIPIQSVRLHSALGNTLTSSTVFYNQPGINDSPTCDIFSGNFNQNQNQKIIYSQNQIKDPAHGNKMQPKQLLFNSNHISSVDYYKQALDNKNQVFINGNQGQNCGSPQNHKWNGSPKANLAYQYISQQDHHSINNQNYYEMKAPMMLQQNIKQLQFNFDYNFFSYNQNDSLQEEDYSHSEINSTLNDQVQITDSSWIDWDDKQKLESHVNKQKCLELQHMFDPIKYFGGLKVQDLENPPDDPRFLAMFQNEGVVEMQKQQSARKQEIHHQQLASQNTQKIVQKYYLKQQQIPKNNNQSASILQNQDYSSSSNVKNVISNSYLNKIMTPNQIKSPNQMSMISNSQTNVIQNLKLQQSQSTLSKNNSPSQKILKQTSISKLIQHQLESSLEKKTQMRIKQENSVSKLQQTIQKYSPRTQIKTSTKHMSSHVSQSASKINLKSSTNATQNKYSQQNLQQQQQLNVNSSNQNLQSQASIDNQSIHLNISNGIYSLKHCLSTGTSPTRVMEQYVKKIKNVIESQNNSKVRMSPFGRLKTSKDDSMNQLKSKIASPSVATVAQKYLKNANRLQSGGNSSKKQPVSQLQVIKSFLSTGVQSNQHNLSKDSSIGKSIEVNLNNHTVFPSNMHQMSAYAKSTERIYVDLSSNNIQKSNIHNTTASNKTYQSINSKLQSMMHSPQPQNQKNQKGSMQNLHNQSQNLCNLSRGKKNISRLNNAIYETLIVNKTSMLKKTTTEMTQSKIINQNQCNLDGGRSLDADNRSKKNDSRNNAIPPKPSMTVANKLLIETQTIFNSQNNSKLVSPKISSATQNTANNSSKANNGKYKQKVVLSKNLYVNLISPNNKSQQMNSDRIQNNTNKHHQSSLSQSQFKF